MDMTQFDRLKSAKENLEQAQLEYDEALNDMKETVKVLDLKIVENPPCKVKIIKRPDRFLFPLQTPIGSITLEAEYTSPILI